MPCSWEPIWVGADALDSPPLRVRDERSEAQIGEADVEEELESFADLLSTSLAIMFCFGAEFFFDVAEPVGELIEVHGA